MGALWLQSGSRICLFSNYVYPIAISIVFSCLLQYTSSICVVLGQSFRNTTIFLCVPLPATEVVYVPLFHFCVPSQYVYICLRGMESPYIIKCQGSFYYLLTTKIRVFFPPKNASATSSWLCGRMAAKELTQVLLKKKKLSKKNFSSESPFNLCRGTFNGQVRKSILIGVKVRHSRRSLPAKAAAQKPNFCFPPSCVLCLLLPLEG